MDSKDQECPRGQRSRKVKKKPALGFWEEGEEDKEKNISVSPKCPILFHHSQSAKPGVLLPGQSNQNSKGFGPEGWRRGTLDGQPRGLGEG